VTWASLTGSRWTFERGAAFAGLASAILMLASAVLRDAPDEGAATDRRLVDFYSSSGNQYRLFVAALVAVLAGLFFLWFLVALSDRLSVLARSRSSALVLPAGLVFVVLWDLSALIGSALPVSFIYSDEFELSHVDTARVILILGNHWLSGAAASTAAFVVGAASLIALRHRLFARPLAWAGLVTAVILLLSIVAFAGITLLGLIVWTAGVSVWLLRGTSAAAAAD
jgi:hypothetical protein